MLELHLFCILGALTHLIIKLKEDYTTKKGFTLGGFIHQRFFLFLVNLLLSLITVIISVRSPEIIAVTPLTSFLIGYSYNSVLANLTNKGGTNGRQN